MRRPYRYPIFTLLVAAFGLATFSSHAMAEDVDLEIVLAVDASGSVSDREFRLQLGGIAAAFLDPTIQRAMLSGPKRRIAVAFMVWSDAALSKFTSQWHVVATPEAAVRFAALVAAFHNKTVRQGGHLRGGTSIGDAIAHSIDMMADNGIEATRRIVDVSGDGIETPSLFGPAVMMPDARTAARSNGVTVNGLAILNEFSHLDRWYRDHVIVGAGSFVIAARDYRDFKRAIWEKLWREFSSPLSNKTMSGNRSR